MKYSIAVCCLGALMVCMGCKKEVTVKEVTNTGSIMGTWELRRAQVSMISTVTYASGNGNMLRFRDSLYQSYTDGRFVKSGQYYIVNDTTVSAEVGLIIPAGQFTQRIVFDDAASVTKTFMELSGNQLTMLSGYFPLDGGARMEYERIVDMP